MLYPYTIWQPLPPGGGLVPFGLNPIGVISHTTDGHNDPQAAWQNQIARQVRTHFWISQEGAVYQWLNTDDRGRHVDYLPNDYYLGIEHAAWPAQGLDLTEAQLFASAALSAYLAWWYGFPIQRSKGCDLTPGFKAHFDLLNPDCQAQWNVNSHSDGIWRCDVPWVYGVDRIALDRSPWSWDDYAYVASYYLAQLTGTPIPGDWVQPDPTYQYAGWDESYGAYDDPYAYYDESYGAYGDPYAYYSYT
jgi:N-acetylmuramoyl-L-alanine amidase